MIIIYCISIIVTGVSFIACCRIIDKRVTIKRIKKNQIAWDEYSKDMTEDEKLAVFVDWIESRKLENGWRYSYIPRL